VLARGPINEAFAEPIDSVPQPGRVVPKQPPEPIEELPPDQKPAGDNVQWIPGYWAWDDERNDFIWVSGIWRNLPPGRQWVPGHWIQAAGGWQWSPGLWAQQGQQQLEFLPPPPQPLSTAASVPAPDNHSVFVPGSWVYRDTRYLWRPGYWMAYQPGWVWIPAHYVWTPAGFVFVDGYWDFELARRGLLFAPVYLQRGYWMQPHWVYRPAYVVQPDFVLGALFVRPGYNHYYFGDYFDTDYRRRGFVAWVDFHRDRFGFDPLYNYYRWQHRDDRRWERDLRGLYAARYSGAAPRPPRTLVQQNTMIQNSTVNRNVNVATMKTVTALTPLTKVDRTVVALQPMSREQRIREQKNVQQLREVSRERAQVETQLLTKGSALVKPSDPPRVGKINLPKPPVPAQVSEQHRPPLPPVIHGTPQVRPETGKPPAAPTPLPKTEGKPDARPQPRPEAKPPAMPPKQEPKPAPKPPATPPKQESKPAAKPGNARPEPKSPPKSEPKPPAQALRLEPRPQHRAEIKPPSPTLSAGHRTPAPAPKDGHRGTQVVSRAASEVKNFPPNLPIYGHFLLTGVQAPLIIGANPLSWLVSFLT
jgi:hypothetical protein